jgi:Glyoxalase/Bleomycin resistance protein/Dioxygenase superfamily
MGDLGALLARLGPGIFQHAWVVEDLSAAKDAMAVLGCGRFVEFEMEQTWDLRGEQVSSTMATAFARSGNVQIELMQPTAGDSVVQEFLDRYGPGPHHHGVRVADLDATVAAAAEDGFAPVMTGQMGSVRICFLDTVDALGLYVELLEDPDGMLWATMPWRDDPPDDRPPRSDKEDR